MRRRKWEPKVKFRMVLEGLQGRSGGGYLLMSIRSVRCRTKEWLQALDMALNIQYPYGVKSAEVKLVSDDECQPTSRAFMKVCGTLGIQQISISYNNPRGNAETERMFHTMKEELLWLRDWESPQQLIDSLNTWNEWYYAEYLHSALGYKSPFQVEEEYHTAKTLLTVV